MPVTEWDPEEADEKALEKDLKKAESTEDEDPESFLEVIEEEDQNLVADDDDVIVEENEEDDDEEEKKPSRQQRRFDQLTAQRREAERRATEASAQNKALQERLEKLEGNNNQAQLNQFQAQYQQTKSALRKAAEEGDTDAQVDLTERLADMRASARIMDMQNEQREQARMTQATAPAQGAPTRNLISVYKRSFLRYIHNRRLGRKSLKDQQPRPKGKEKVLLAKIPTVAYGLQDRSLKWLNP